jgi:hypothetical protein
VPPEDKTCIKHRTSKISRYAAVAFAALALKSQFVISNIPTPLSKTE